LSVQKRATVSIRNKKKRKQKTKKERNNGIETHLQDKKLLSYAGWTPNYFLSKQLSGCYVNERMQHALNIQ